MAVSAADSHAWGSTPFILQVSINEAMTAQFLAPASCPAKRAFFLLCRGLHNRKNWLFAGADTGGETLARAMTIIETAKLNGLDPQAYLADVLDRIQDHKINRLDEFLPWNWVPLATAQAKAA